MSAQSAHAVCVAKDGGEERTGLLEAGTPAHIIKVSNQGRGAWRQSLPHCCVADCVSATKSFGRRHVSEGRPHKESNRSGVLSPMVSVT